MTPAEELARYAPGAATLLTLGVFDGVHMGHLSLIQTLRRQAASRGLIPGVVTFEPHPIEVLHPGERLPLLAGLEERIRLLQQAGVDLVAPLTFTPELSRMGPEEFVGLLRRHLDMEGLILGPDFSLGRDRAGTVATLEAVGARLGFSVAGIAAFMLDGRVVSSTAIRAALAEGGVVEAARMLGRWYSLSGPITTTSQRGTSLGFPTANLEVDSRRALPRNGVYATIATIPDGRFGSVTNIGHRPTFGPTERIVETHILDFRGRIYGAPLTIEFVARLRDEATFGTAEELIAQIHRDVESARGILGEYV
jgi:riboflavin kinase / FMN adenylyltransferase